MSRLSRSSWEGRKAPELERGVDWINSPPLTLASLKGNVLLLDFWDYTCVNCLRTIPYVQEWHRRYRNFGLIIIGVHTPEFSFSGEEENIRQAVKELGIEYPVVIDSRYQIWHAYHNRWWPRKLLTDAQGIVRYDHIGEGGYHETEQKIQLLLRDIHPQQRFSKVMKLVRDEDRPGVVCYPRTAEVYAGFQRGELGNSGGYRENQVYSYTDPGEYRDGVLALGGTWRSPRRKQSS